MSGLDLAGLDRAACAAAPAGTEQQQVGDYDATFMDEAGIEARGLALHLPAAERVGVW